MPTFNIPEVEFYKSPLGAALRECEIHCVSACCGMGAYEITQEHLHRWAAGGPGDHPCRGTAPATGGIAQPPR